MIKHSDIMAKIFGENLFRSDGDIIDQIFKANVTSLKFLSVVYVKKQKVFWVYTKQY